MGKEIRKKEYTPPLVSPLPFINAVRLDDGGDVARSGMGLCKCTWLEE